MLVVDGTDAELVRGILETDMLSMEERHKKTISFWEFWGEQGPGLGYDLVHLSVLSICLKTLRILQQ